LRAAVRGRLTLLDAVVLIGLYALYLRRSAASESESPEPIGVSAELAALPADQRRRWVAWLMVFAAAVILMTAVPFGDAVLASGQLVGISPYLLVQWLVPVATEVPELVVASVLLTHGRGGQSVAVLLAGAVSQYTLALGTLPIAYAVGRGTGPLPLAGRERVELFLSVAVALYAVAALVTLRLSRGDTAIMLVLFTIQFLLPGVMTRIALALAFMTLAVDVLVHERRYVPALLRALRDGPPQGRGQRAPVPDPPVDAYGDELELWDSAAPGDDVERLHVHERVADRHRARRANDRPVDRGATKIA
jgi:cation:H+ antiporter